MSWNMCKTFQYKAFMYIMFTSYNFDYLVTITRKDLGYILEMERSLVLSSLLFATIV